MGLKVPDDFNSAFVAELNCLCPLFYKSHESSIAFIYKNQNNVVFKKESFNDSLEDRSPCEHFIYSAQHESVGIGWKISLNVFLMIKDL